MAGSAYKLAIRLKQSKRNGENVEKVQGSLSRP